MKQKKVGKDAKAVLEELYRLYEQPMYQVAFSILHQVQQSEDAVQDAFLKLFKYLPRIQQPQDDKTKRLVIRVIKTTAIDQYRKNHKDCQMLTTEDSLKEDKIIAMDASQQAVDRDLISRLLYELQPIYLEIIKMRCYFGFSNRETARILNISEDVASKRLERAKKLVQKRMGDEIYEESKSGIGTIAEKAGGGSPHRAASS